MSQRQPSSRDIAKMIDHSLLHPTLTERELREGCAAARQDEVASVCVKPCHVKLAAELLDGSEVLVGAVIGFPHGNGTVALKVAEAEQVVADGAQEVDMVINIAKAIEEDWAYLENEIGSVHRAVAKGGAILKVIFETDYLDRDRIVRLCQVCATAGAEFVKTSSGYNYVKTKDGHNDYAGATLEIMKLMCENTPKPVRVKAAGKVRGLDMAVALWRMGVSRIGTSQTAQIVAEARVKLDGA
jgi:deoxyribose-phosphate aldolase